MMMKWALPLGLHGVKITRIAAYQVDLPLFEKTYKWADGKFVDCFDATVVVVHTNVDGLYGVGESTPLGSAYLPAYAGGVRAGLKELAPHLIGHNPTQLQHINNVMDTSLRGHNYVKSPVDVACWDILGKIAGLPVCELLGGRGGGGESAESNSNSRVRLYRAISQGSPSDMAANVASYVAEGYRCFQLKVGGEARSDIERIRAVRKLLDEKTLELREAARSDPSGPNAARDRDLFIPLMCDANTGWLRHDAIRVMNGVRDLDVMIEQPCVSYDECLAVRRVAPSLPFILDESVDSLGMLMRALSDGAADAVNLKISKLGGLSKARVLRDVAVASGLPMNIEDTWGGDIVTAAIAHFAHSTPSRLQFCSTDFNSYGPARIAHTTAHRCKVTGSMAAPTEPGLGVEPIWDALGKPLVDVSK